MASNRFSSGASYTYRILNVQFSTALVVRAPQAIWWQAGFLFNRMTSAIRRRKAIGPSPSFSERLTEKQFAFGQAQVFGGVGWDLGRHFAVDVRYSYGIEEVTGYTYKRHTPNGHPHMLWVSGSYHLVGKG